MKIFLIIFLIIVVLVVLAVVYPIITGRAPAGKIRGDTLFKSEDGGESWQNLSSFPGGEITILRPDQNPEEFLLIGTERRGIWRGKRDGSEWKQFQGALGEGSKIFDIFDRTALAFFAKRGRVVSFETNDAKELLFTPLERFAYLKGRRAGEMIQVIGSDGGFYESLNGGRTWTALSRFREGLLLLEANRTNSSEIWVIDGRGGFSRSRDGGKTWGKLSETEEAKIIFYEARTGILYQGSRRGLLESFDKGRTWEPLGLPAEAESLPVTAFTADSKGRLFAGARNQLYISGDRGLSWKVVMINSAGSISSILIDPKDPKKIFIGLKGRERAR